jgi:hypothetical protein
MSQFNSQQQLVKSFPFRQFISSSKMSSAPTTPRNRKGSVPPGGFSSVVFDDNMTPVTDLRVSYSRTAESSAGTLGAHAFGRRARGGLSKRQESMKDLLFNNDSLDSPRSGKRGAVPPGGHASIVIG